MSQHYLGLTYCKPNEAGLASEARAVGKRLGALLDALGNVNECIIERGELTNELWEFKSNLIDKLKADGWLITIPKNNYLVKPPKADPRKTMDEFEIQGNYGTGFEVVTCEDTRAAALQMLQDYRTNEPKYSFRLVKKRVPKVRSS